jgi:DNA-binding transcriptional ArsR family regulator
MSARDVFDTSLRRVREAIKAGTMEARPEKHFSWTQALVDLTGWETIVAGVDGMSRRVAEAQIDSGSRTALSGEQPIPVTVVLAAFESPQGAVQKRFPVEPSRKRPSVGSPPADDALRSRERAEALAEPLRLEIMEQASMRAMAPRSFFEQLGGDSPQSVGHHFEALRKHGWLRLAEAEDDGTRRGGLDRLYCVDRAAVIDTASWSALPGSMRAFYMARAFDAYSRKVKEALEAGTLDAREGRPFSCATMLLDRLGWERLIAMADTLLDFTLAEQEKARRRLIESGEKPLLATTGLMVFESPGGPAKRPRHLGHLAAAPYRPATRRPTLRLLK